jgi:hypothetical protein
MEPTEQDDARKNPKKPARHRRRLRSGMIGAGLLVAGLVVGAGATILATPSRSVTLLSATEISSLKPWTIVAVKGQVSEIYGNKFILQDSTGRTLVDTGRRGQGVELVTASEPVTVQGRFENNFLHADVIIHANGEAENLAPPPPGPRGFIERSRQAIEGIRRLATAG